MTQPKMMKFNPSFQSDDEAVANFVVRQREFETIMQQFVGGDGTPGSPRVIVTAPRGAGKTTLCRRVVAESRRAGPLSQQWHPIFFGEESYSVTTPGEFFLECLFQLNDQEKQGLQAAFERAVASTNEVELLERTVGALRDFSNNIGKRLLIIAENFHIILGDQIGEEAEKLLSHLSDDSVFGVLATSVALGDIEGDALLRAHFLPVPLNPLTLQECHTLWVALTHQSVGIERIRPLEILTGGSPRLIHILAEFMQTPSLEHLMANLNHLIDQNTEYFKSQLDGLPAIERKVFAALLDAWDPSTAKDVAAAARVNTNIASAMLARLTERGAVIKQMGRGRAAIYSAAERLFNIYYLMRRRSHPSSRVRALVAFMTEYYDGAELIDTSAKLINEACGLDPERRGDHHHLFDGIMARSSKDVRVEILKRTPREFMDSFLGDQSSKSTAETALAPLEADEALSDEIGALITQIEEAVDSNSEETAAELLMQLRSVVPDISELWTRVALLESQIENYAEAVSAARKADELDPESSWVKAVLGMTLRQAGDSEEAALALQSAIDLDPSNLMASSELAELEEEDNNLDAAIEILKRANGHSDGLPEHVRVQLAKLLMRSDRLDEAEALLRSAILDPDGILSRRLLSDLLDDKGQTEEALSLLRTAAEETGKWEAWSDLGAFLHGGYDDQRAAVAAFETAIARGADSPFVYRQLAHAMQEDGRNPESIRAVAVRLTEALHDDPNAWITAGGIYRSVHEASEAEKAYRTAIDKGNSGYACLLLARLLQDSPDRLAEAEQFFRQAIADAPGSGACGPSKELALLLVHNGRDDDAEVVLKSALEKNDECYCCLVRQGEICVRKGRETEAIERFDAALALHPTGAPALLGKSRVVDEQEGAELVARALAASPDDPECLLRRAQLGPVNEERLADAKRAMELGPDLMEPHLFLAPIDAKMSRSEEALAHLRFALDHLQAEREWIPTFVASAMSVAQAGDGQRVQAMIAESDAAPVLEPLIVALQLLNGESPLVAKEILEVANDIVRKAKTPAPLGQQDS